MNKKNNKKGFTIVELVIVIAVIGILATVLIPTFSGVIDSADDAAELQEARNAYTEYLIANPRAEVDFVKIGDNYYDVNDGYDIDTAAEACGGVLEVADSGVSFTTKAHVNTATPADGKCDLCGDTMPTT